MIGGHVYTDTTTLIKGGYILTMDSELGDLAECDVLIDGAKACGLDHNFGMIVIAADTSNVDTVFVAGRIIKYNGQLTRIDLPRLLSRLDGVRDHLLSNAGVIPKWTLSRSD